MGRCAVKRVAQLQCGMVLIVSTNLAMRIAVCNAYVLHMTGWTQTCACECHRQSLAVRSAAKHPPPHAAFALKLRPSECHNPSFGLTER